MQYFLLPKKASFSKEAKIPAFITVLQLQGCYESGRLL